MRIVSLTVENIKRISAVHIDTKGAPVIVLAGQNEQGKSSVIDAIQMALGGKDAIPPMPVHGTADKGKIIADLGDFVVTRRFTAAGGTSLTVQTRDGAKYPSPQAMLDGFVGRLSFDPFAFSTQDPVEQAKTLRILCQINTTDLDLQRKAAFDDRALVNRDVKTLQAQLAGMPMHPDVSTDSAPIDALVLKLATADSAAEAASAATFNASRAADAVRGKTDAVNILAGRVKHLAAELAAAEVALEEAEAAASMAADALTAAKETVVRLEALVPDRTALRSALLAAQATKSQIADNARYAEARARLDAAVTQADTLTATIDQCDAMKADLLAKAPFPVAGLGLADECVTWNGLPFQQASTAVKIKVSVAIGVALNPKLRVMLVRNGNDLDDKSMAALAALAEEHDCQAWVERINGATGVPTVVIEDGTVKGA